jgi:hypothetical protein
MASCKKEIVREIDLGYEYFPNLAGTYIEYEVDSTYHGITVNNSHFFLREEFVSEFVDDQGQLAMRVERSKRPNTSSEWVLTDIWTQKRTPTTAERVEENVRFVRMVFPVHADKTWDGNSYNTYSTWEHSFQSIGAAKTVGSLSFGNTVTVRQRNNVNLVDQEEASEIYARDIGLIYKKFVDLSFQNFEITGVEMEWIITDYGIID